LELLDRMNPTIQELKPHPSNGKPGSANGVLQSAFPIQTRLDDHNRQLFCFYDAGGAAKPKSHVNPGEHLIVTVEDRDPQLQ
jgi:hypothetical protein